MAVVAAYLGEADEEKINSMSYVFFEDVLMTVGKMIDYEAVSNYAGNSFCKDSWKMIQESNPLRKKAASNMGGFVDL